MKDKIQKLEKIKETIRHNQQIKSTDNLVKAVLSLKKRNKKTAKRNERIRERILCQ